MVIGLDKLQTIAQFGMGLAFIMTGVLPFFQSRVEELDKTCKAAIEQFAFDDVADNEFFTKFSDLAQNITQVGNDIYLFEKRISYVESLSSIIFIFMIPAFIYGTLLICYPFFPDYRFEGRFAVLGEVAVFAWLPACVVLGYISVNYARLSATLRRRIGDAEAIVNGDEPFSASKAFGPLIRVWH